MKTLHMVLLVFALAFEAPCADAGGLNIKCGKCESENNFALTSDQRAYKCKKCDHIYTLKQVVRQFNEFWQAITPTGPDQELMLIADFTPEGYDSSRYENSIWPLLNSFHQCHGQYQERLIRLGSRPVEFIPRMQVRAVLEGAGITRQSGKALTRAVVLTILMMLITNPVLNEDALKNKIMETLLALYNNYLQSKIDVNRSLLTHGFNIHEQWYMKLLKIVNRESQDVDELSSDRVNAFFENTRKRYYLVRHPIFDFIAIFRASNQYAVVFNTGHVVWDDEREVYKLLFDSIIIERTGFSTASLTNIMVSTVLLVIWLHWASTQGSSAK